MKLGFREERIKRIVRELKDLSIMDRSLIEEVYKKDGFYKTREEANQAEGLFEVFHPDQLWGGKDVYAWFTCQLNLPELRDHEKLVYRLETLDEGWDALNPQGLLFFDGKVVQGLDVNHRTCPIPSDLKGKIQIDVQGYGGSSNPMSGVKGKSLFQQFLLKVDDRIEKLYYDMKIPLEVAELQREDSREKLYLLDSLEQALQALDLRKPYSEDFYKGIGKADQILADMIYNKDFDNNEIAACVGHTHIDVAWLWDLNETRQKVQRSFATVLKNMEDYPKYVFMSSQPQLYQFLKEERPELYDRVKERVAEGRWEPEGAMWVEADCNLSSGESFIRQIIYGKQFFRNEFGVENRVLWLPDVFGYSAALPQILRKCGVDYFMTTKISWNEYNKIPYDTLKWIGIDGTDVLAHFITTTDVRRLAQSHTTTYNG